MVSLLKARHGEYMDLERVITKHLSLESARLLREDPELAEEVLGDEAVKRVLDTFYVNEIYASPKRQVAMWRHWLHDMPGCDISWEQLLAAAPPWPEEKNSFLLLSAFSTDRDGRLVIGAWLAEHLRARRISTDVFDTAADRGGASLKGVALKWEQLKVADPEEGGVPAATIDLLTAAFLHRRWLNRLGIELPLVFADRNELAPVCAWSWARTTRREDGKAVTSKIEPLSPVEDGIPRARLVVDNTF